jgi:hypothetical protein
MKEALVEQAVGSRDAGMKAREVAMFRSASACGVTVTAPGPHLAMEVESSRNYPGQSMQMQSRWRSLVPLALFTLTTCSGDPNTAPEIRPADQISIVWLASDHPDFYGTEVSFWAKQNQDTEGSLYFKDDQGQRGEEYARLRIRQGSLKAYPDGRPFGAEDSVLITMRVADATRIIVELLPSGLQFNAGNPAELKLEYGHDDPDLNHDGQVDSTDQGLQHQLAIWVQEVVNGPFAKTASVNSESLEEIEASLLGFSRFAVAY